VSKVLLVMGLVVVVVVVMGVVILAARVMVVVGVSVLVTGAVAPVAECIGWTVVA